MGIKVLFLPYESEKNPYQVRLAQALEELGVRVLSVPTGRAPLRWAIRLQRNEGLDVVHLHWTSPFLVSSRHCLSLIKGLLFLLAVLWLKFTGVRLVWSVHNLTSHENQNPGLELYFNRRLGRMADQIIVHCPSAIGQVMSLYSFRPDQQKKISVIPHAHFIGDYPGQCTIEEARERLDLPMDARTFLFFGQIRRYKNVLSLVEAFQRLDEPRARLIIAGEPCDEAVRQELKTAIQNDLRIHAELAWIPDREVPIYMAAADVVVLPFTEILTSSTVVLAMSFGKPLITPALGCSRDLLAHQGGLLYCTADPDGLYQAMCKAMVIDLHRLGENNRQEIDKYRWADSGLATCGVYKKVLGIE